MASLPVYDRRGQEVGKYEIDSTDVAVAINKQLLHDVVVMYQANQRQGSFKTKSRAEVAAARQKLYRQKGTGRARAGHRTSGTRRGGGHIFAKRPRDFSYRLPKKAVRLATKMAIASKIRDNQMVVLDELVLDEPKTKIMVDVLKSLGLDATKTLVATASHDPNVYKSARNIPGLDVCPVADLNALCVLKPERMLVTKAALDAIRSGETASEEGS
ncbi:MAG: 50S ribosomal protein L4 [Pirellulaceae bacterium]|nr:50S ribosomal protein L4 [Pirellulaceae bacterium]